MAGRKPKPTAIKELEGNPGGGVTRGANTQEECLCRCSSLYFCLNTPEMWSGFYQPHRYAQDPLHNDDIVYTPNVTVFKTDTAVRGMSRIIGFLREFLTDGMQSKSLEVVGATN